MPHTTRWQLPGPHGEPLYGNTHLPEGAARGVLIITHGLKGYKDYGFFPALADTAARNGLIAHRYNLSFSGMTHDVDTFAKPDAVERDTWSGQVRDIHAVLDFIDADDLPSRDLPVILFGHSRGGLASILAASRLGDRVAGLISASAPAEADRFSDEDKTTLRTQGKLDMPSSRTGQMLHVGQGFLDDLEANEDSLDPVRVIREITCPILLIHGNDDATVPVTDMQRLHDANPQSRTVAIDTDHVFGSPNPLSLDAEIPDTTQALIDATIGFASGLSQPLREV